MRKGLTKIVGCGGIGKGYLFHSLTNETLGRSESRLVMLSDAKDYCKQQIVFYYIAALLKGRAAVYPVGAVGDDSVGRELVGLMRQQGMDVSHVAYTKSSPTMLSVCLQYPDKEGCNFTAQNSAAGEVSPEYIEGALDQIGIDDETCIVAIPEVRIDTRVDMLRIGHTRGALCALSVPVAEAEEFEKMGAYAFCDLVSVNEAEAQSMTNSQTTGKALTYRLLEYLHVWRPDIMVCVTLGGSGAFCGYRNSVEHIPAYPSNVVNTTGAGDAFLGALVSGLALGLPFMKGREDAFLGESVLCTAPELATVCAGMAVESEDSIAENVNLHNILGELDKRGWKQKILCPELFTEQRLKR